jgi:CubicO group peptidase (beta-lactamase class C family)
MEDKRAREFLRSKIENGIFTGASVIFAKSSEKLVEIHEGQIGRDIKDPITPSTLFDLQSITKSVSTAALAVQLIESGRIDLDGSVGSHLPENKNPAFNQITFRQLFNHSSGLSDSSLAGDFRDPNQLWKHMLSAEPSFTPGTAIEYTDLGYRILGKALEGILSMDLDTASKRLLWKPLGLNQMTFDPKDKVKTAATPDAHGFIDDEQVKFLGGVLGCDGVFSNADDLFKFMAALLKGSSPFSTNTLQAIATNKASFETNLPTFFDSLAVGPKNLGWEVNPKGVSYAGRFQRNGNCIEKAGGAGTFIWLDTETGYMMVYLTNYGKPKPFDEASWNRLIADIEPHTLTDILYETI